MPFFGRKKPNARDEPWRGWPDTLNVDDSADVDWIKQANDPLVWHAAALACLLFRGDKHGLIAWLVQQSTLDRVTAAAIFLHRGNGVARLTGGRLDCNQMSEAQVEEVIDLLCELDEVRTLADHGIGMEAGWEHARSEAVARLAGNPRLPRRILGYAIDQQTSLMPYTDIGEGDLVTQKFMRETMPFLFD